MSEHDTEFATVAVWLPGTINRVTVDMLEGDDAEVRRLAKTVVQEFAFMAPVQWQTRVIGRQQVTDIPHPDIPPETP